jgi:hypothetical protein
LSSNHQSDPTTKAKRPKLALWARYHCNIPWSSSKFLRVGGTDLHRMPSDGWPSYFGAAAYHVPPTTVLFRQETKLQGTTSCLFPWVVWFGKTIASFKPFCFLRFFRSSLWTKNTEPEHLTLWAGQPRNWISIRGKGKNCCILPQRLDRFWCPYSFQSIGLRRLSGWSVNLITHHHLVPWPRQHELYLHSPYVFTAWCLISIGATLPLLITFYTPNMATPAYNWYPVDLNSFPLQTCLLWTLIRRIPRNATRYMPTCVCAVMT